MISSNTGVDHAVLEYLIGFVGQFYFIKQFGDDAEFFALFFCDNTFDQGGVGEVVGFDVLVLHFFVAIPGFPEFFTSDLTINDGVVTYSSGSDA